MTREDRFTEEELKEMQSKNYDLVHDMATKLNSHKGYEVGYANPRKGKMIINYNGQNFLVDIEPITTVGEPTIENAMKEYNHIFK